MPSHTTDWFPGRVSKAYKDNYPRSMGKVTDDEKEESTEEEIPETGETANR